MATETAHAPQTNFNVSNEKMGMWAFLGSELLFFGAFITIYLIYVPRTADGPGPEVFDIPFTSVSTFILLMSSLAMVLALAGIQDRDLRRFRTWTLATALMGLVFLGGQLYEFTVFVQQDGLGLTTSAFSTAFYVLTSFHKVHVAIGVLMLGTLWFMSFTGRIRADGHGTNAVENVGLYWHFVDIIWIVIFTIVYLIPVDLAT